MEKSVRLQLLCAGRGMDNGLSRLRLGKAVSGGNQMRAGMEVMPTTLSLLLREPTRFQPLICLRYFVADVP